MAFNYENYVVNSKYRRMSSIRRVRSYRNYRLFYLIYWGLIGSGLVSLLLLPWIQTVAGRGRVIAYSPDQRRQEISAPVDGMVEKWMINEGARVVKDQPIVQLADNDPNIIHRLELERDAYKQQVESTRNAKITAKRNVDRQEKLLAKGLSSPLSIEKARINYNKYEVEESKAIAELSRIEVRLARQNNQLIRSPADGYLLEIKAGQGGQLVKQGQPLAVLVPDAETRAVELLIDGNDMPLLTVGRQVRLQFEGWPAVQFSGWPNVAVGTFGGIIGTLDAADDGQGRFRILVFENGNEIDKWPSSKYLRQGVQAKGWIQLDEVRLGYELWRIFNGFPPALKKQTDPYDAKKYGSSTDKEEKK